MCVDYYDRDCYDCIRYMDDEPQVYCLRCGKMIDCDCFTCLSRNICTKEEKTV